MASLSSAGASPIEGGSRGAARAAAGSQTARWSAAGAASARVLTNARVVAPEEVFVGTVVLEGGTIEAIDTGVSRFPGAEDIGGDYLLPGLIDVHTDNLEKHLVPRPGVLWDPAAAAVDHDAQLVAAGITTVLDSLRVGSVESAERRALLGTALNGLELARRRHLLRADHLLHLRCDLMDPALIDQLTPHLDDPRLRFITMSDNSAARNPERFRAKLAKQGVEPARIARQLRETLENDAAMELANRREVVALARAVGVPAASHDDAELWHIEQARALGLHVCEFPLTRHAAEAARAHGLILILGSPNLVRGFSHAGNVSVAELARRRTLDVLCSDYVPSSLLQGVFALAGPEIGYSLPEAVATATDVPATIMNLTDRGAIRIGARADLVRVAAVDDDFAVRTVWCAGERVY